MKCWDDYGRVCEIPREDWRTKVLPINFQRTWNDADKLAALIDNAINDGFFADCLEPVRHLYRIDATPKRAVNVLAFVLIKLNQLDEAERILNEALKRHGKDSLFLNNLAKVHFGRGNQALVESNLWESIALDPNLENSMGWYVAIHRERGGDPDAVECLDRIAALPGSWRAQLWLAGAALKSRNLDRALELYQAALARVQTLVPWIKGEVPAFVFSGVAWEDADAAVYARQTEIKSGYVVIAFLKPNAEPWTAELRLVRTIDAKCLGTASGSFSLAQPEAGLSALANKLLALLREQTEVQTVSPPPQYQNPVAPWFASYLLRLEQLLAVRCSSMDGVPSGFLSGEREIVDGNLQLCLEYPQNVGVRILFVQTLLAMKRARPAVVAEYRDKVARLQREKPLTEPAHSVVQRLINEVFTA